LWEVILRDEMSKLCVKKGGGKKHEYIYSLLWLKHLNRILYSILLEGDYFFISLNPVKKIIAHKIKIII